MADYKEAQYGLLSNNLPQFTPAPQAQGLLDGMQSAQTMGINQQNANSQQKQVESQAALQQQSIDKIKQEMNFSQIDLTNKLASTVIDAPSYQSFRTQMEKAGIDTSDLPTTYDANAQSFVKQAQQLSGVAKEQLQAELIKAQTANQNAQATKAAQPAPLTSANTTTIIDPVTKQQKIVPITEAVKSGAPVYDSKNANINFDNTSKLRTEFVAQSREYAQVVDAHNRIQASAVNPSAAGDLALIFNYMKMLDPGSTVREGEFATAQNSASIPDIVRAKYNKVIAGERLADDQRNDFVNRSQGLLDAQQKSQTQREIQYAKLAEQQGLDPKNVIVDYRGQQKPATPTTNELQATPDVIAAYKKQYPDKTDEQIKTAIQLHNKQIQNQTAEKKSLK